MVWILFAVGLWTGAALFSALEGRKQRRFLERWNGWPFRPDGRPRARGRPRSFPEFSGQLSHDRRGRIDTGRR